MKHKAKKKIILYENWVSWNSYQIVKIHVDNLMNMLISDVIERVLEL